MGPQRSRWRRVGAAAAAAAGLLGGSPPAAEAPRGPAPAPACRADPDPADAAAVAAMIEALRRLPERRTPDGEAVVTLDNRGYGYDPGRPPAAELPHPLPR
jgi:hypothetical protein